MFKYSTIKVLFAGLIFLCAGSLNVYAQSGVEIPVFEDGLDYFESGQYNEAAKIFKRLAANKDAPSQYYLGLMMDNGLGMAKNASSAVNWIHKSANEDYLPALTYMGYAYSTGHGTGRPNQQEAFKWYSRAAGLGDAVAQNNLGMMLRSGTGHEKDFNLASQWFLQAATQGNSRAQYNLANMYEKGEGIKVNYGEALRWYGYAAQQGDVYALNALGDMYYNGFGVIKDSIVALEWYRAAAAKGHVPAMFSVAQMYEMLEDPTKGPEDAIVWYERAAEKGHVQSMHWLANLYEMGIGAEQNFSEAIRWYKAAGEENYFIPSRIALARLYESGKGVPKNIELARKMYQELAESGDPESQFELGRFYRFGLGGAIDLVQAYQWFALAAKDLPEGEKKSNAIVSRIETANTLSETDLARARDMVLNWQPKKIMKPKKPRN